MKKLLNTLYVTTSDARLALDGENVVVYQGDDALGRFPLHNLEGIVVFGYIGASPALMGACVSRNISLCFLTPFGKFLARVVGKEYGNVTLRKTQYSVSADEVRSAEISKSFLLGKIYNSRWVIERAIRDYPMRLDVERLKTASGFLKRSTCEIMTGSNLEQLRGIEGEAASVYFGVFDELILQQKDSFHFNVRNRRPPLDNVNALLSFVYTLLANQTAAALTTVGLDSYVGFLHRDRPGRISLALDLMEELRCVYADRFVLSIINKKIITASGFEKKEDGAVVMTDDTRKVVLTAWQNKKQEIITHPFIQEKLEWGLVPYVQAMLLARYLRGDIDAYPPFLWK